jgi:hypothetical protein
MTEPPPENGKEGPGKRGNLVALIAVIALIALGYWTFTALEHGRRFQQCLDSGRHNCEDYVDQGR